MENYKELEVKFAEYIETKYCSACSSGTAALTLAVAALGIHKGDEVIVPEFTMIATAWAVTYCGGVPVFVDCGEDLNINPDLIEEKITDRTKAIIVTHIYGRPCNMLHITEICKKHNLYLIEDACEAHGALYQGKRVGSFGDIGCFSLYKNKIISSEEGGLCVTNSEELKNEMDDIKNMAFGGRHDYLHLRQGYNFRITDMQSSVALKQLSHIGRFIAHRKEMSEIYDRHLGRFSIPRPFGSVVWVYDFVVPSENTRNLILRRLLSKGIQARPFFKPMSMQPQYLGEYKTLRAFDFSKRGLYLPVRNDMKKDEVEQIIKIISKIL